MQESVGFDYVGEFCDSQIKTVKGDGNCFFRSISYLSVGTQEFYVYIGLKVTQFIRSDRGHIQNVLAYLKQPKIEENSVWATENDTVVAARLIHKDVGINPFHETNYRS